MSDERGAPKDGLAELDAVRVAGARWMVPVEDGVLIGRRATVLKRVRGRAPFPDLAMAVQSALSLGARSIDEVVAGLTDYPPALVADVTRKLLALGVLEPDGEDVASASDEPPTPAQDAMAANARYFVEHGADPEASLRRLAAGYAAVWGPGEVAQRLVSDLEAWGVGRITVIDTSIDGVLRVASINGAQAEFTDSDEADVRAIAEEADVLVGCADDPVRRLQLFPRIDDLSLQLDKPWLAGYLEGDEMLLGPLFVPGETGCYRCLEAREESHMPHPAEFHAFKDYIRQAADFVWNEPPLAGRSMLAGALALEVMRILSRATFPSTYQTLVSLSLTSFESRRHTLLKVPFCEWCGPQQSRPFRRIWDL